MEDRHQLSAMSEIALALAMAFFSIMVLTLISMGTGGLASTESKSTSDQKSVATMLAPNQTSAAKAAVVQLGSDDIFVVYHRGAFYDRDLHPVDPATIRTKARVLLALDPQLPMVEAVAARARINVENLIVSTLDERWRETLARLDK